jgi:hypothetical protein
MTDEQMPNEIPAFAKPWINLIHTVGLPWVMICLSAYYGIPFANDALNTQREVKASVDALNKRAEDAMPLLQKAVEAVPILEAIHRTNMRAAADRHIDAVQTARVLESAAETGKTP